MRLYGMAATAVGHQPLATGFLDAAVACLRADGRLALLAQALILRAWSGFHLGSRPRSVADLEEGARLAVETSQPLWEARARAGQAALRRRCAASPRPPRRWPPRSSASPLPAHASAALADVQHVRGIAALGAGRHARRLRAAAARLRPGRSGAPLHEEPVGDRRPRRGGGAQRPPRTTRGRCCASSSPPPPARRRRASTSGCGTRGRCWRAQEPERYYAAALDADLGAGRSPARGCSSRSARGCAASAGSPSRGRRCALPATRSTRSAALPWGERARQELRASGESSRRRQRRTRATS